MTVSLLPSRRVVLVAPLLSAVLLGCGDAEEPSSNGDAVGADAPSTDPSSSEPSSIDPTPVPTPQGTAGGPTTAVGGFSCPTNPGTPNLSATPRPVADVPLAGPFGEGFSIIEGPVWTGNTLYFSHIATDTQPNPSRIYRIAAGGTPEIWLDTAFSNGLALSDDGALIVARHSDGTLTRIDLVDKSESVIVDNFEGETFNSPNDIAVRSDGNLYFTDPDYQKPSSRTGIPTRIYRVAPQGAVSVVDGTQQNPNGVTLSLDENWLYVGGQMPLTRYPVMADGSTGPGETLGNTAEMLRGSDGMGMDCAGNLYVTSNRAVSVVDTNSPTFEVIGSFTFPDIQSVTNVAFGGPTGTTLYVTSLGTAPKLFTVDVGIIGRPY